VFGAGCVEGLADDSGLPAGDICKSRSARRRCQGRSPEGPRSGALTRPSTERSFSAPAVHRGLNTRSAPKCCGSTCTCQGCPRSARRCAALTRAALLPDYAISGAPTIKSLSSVGLGNRASNRGDYNGSATRHFRGEGLHATSRTRGLCSVPFDLRRPCARQDHRGASQHESGGNAATPPIHSGRCGAVRSVRPAYPPNLSSSAGGSITSARYRRLSALFQLMRASSSRLSSGVSARDSGIRGQEQPMS
jgi:hypothetical protein